MLESFWFIPLLIFVINIVYVSFNTIRMILTMKGEYYAASFISLFEIVMYVVGLGLVLTRLSDIQNIIAYALGFAVGIIVGMKIEDKLALGYITVNVITGDFTQNLPEQLRQRGYGVTHWITYGRGGERLMMEILTPRKWEKYLYQRVNDLDPSAFLISHEPKAFHGGFWVKAIRRRNKKMKL